MSTGILSTKKRKIDTNAIKTVLEDEKTQNDNEPEQLSNSYDFKPKEGIFRPIWMASDIGLDAADIYMYNKDKQVLGLIDKNGNTSNWMWISFGLRCVD